MPGKADTFESSRLANSARHAETYEVRHAETYAMPGKPMAGKHAEYRLGTEPTDRRPSGRRRGGGGSETALNMTDPSPAAQRRCRGHVGHDGLSR